MNILVIGTGYVGATTAILLAELGHQVTGLDMEEEKIKRLQQGVLTFYEPGLEPLLQKQLQLENLTFTTDSVQAIQEHDVIFICVGTPSLPDGSTDLSAVRKVSARIGQLMASHKLIVMKSTVPPGTQQRVKRWIKDALTYKTSFDVVSNPEFLREGSAVHDAFHPDRIIIGGDSEESRSQVELLYGDINCPVVHTNPETAEMIKYASNAFLATKISYMNELARLCDEVDVSIQTVAEGMGYDPRIGKSFLQAGIGYGGSCFPKDVKSLIALGNEHYTELGILKRVVKVNESQYRCLLKKVKRQLGLLRGKRIALLGLAFKPGTDDLREAPSLAILSELMENGALLKVHDPVAKLPRELQFPSIKAFPSIEETLLGAHAIILCTEWPQYVNGAWEDWRPLVKSPYVFDGRNALDAKKLKALGYHYEGIGVR